MELCACVPPSRNSHRLVMCAIMHNGSTILNVEVVMLHGCSAMYPMVVNVDQGVRDYAVGTNVQCFVCTVAVA